LFIGKNFPGIAHIMHTISISGVADNIRMAEVKGSFTTIPDGSFPVESDYQSINTAKMDDRSGSNNSRRFCINKDCAAYQELRELRLPSVHKLRRSAKNSINKLRCRGMQRSVSGGVTTYDDFTADLYGCDVDDELPLLVDLYMHGDETMK
jgi:hypothetical protein